MTVPSRKVSIRTSIEIGEIGSPVGTSPDDAVAEIETLEEVISGGEYSVNEHSVNEHSDSEHSVSEYSDSKYSDNKYSDNEHSDSEHRLPRRGWRLCLTECLYDSSSPHPCQTVTQFPADQAPRN